MLCSGFRDFSAWLQNKIQAFKRMLNKTLSGILIQFGDIRFCQHHIKRNARVLKILPVTLKSVIWSDGPLDEYN